MQYDELIKACINLIQEYDDKIETPDSFVEKCLKKVRIKYIYLFFLFKRLLKTQMKECL